MQYPFRLMFCIYFGHAGFAMLWRSPFMYVSHVMIFYFIYIPMDGTLQDRNPTCFLSMAPVERIKKYVDGLQKVS